MRKNSKILVFAKLKDTQYAEAGCYYKKKVRWKILQFQKM